MYIEPIAIVDLPQQISINLYFIFCSVGSISQSKYKVIFFIVWFADGNQSYYLFFVLDV